MYDDDIAILVDMGFAPEKAAQALQFTHGNREEAIDMLLIPIRAHLYGDTVASGKKKDKKEKEDDDGMVYIPAAPSSTTASALLAKEPKTGPATTHGAYHATRKNLATIIDRDDDASSSSSGGTDSAGELPNYPCARPRRTAAAAHAHEHTTVPVPRAEEEDNTEVVRPGAFREGPHRDGTSITTITGWSSSGRTEERASIEYPILEAERVLEREPTAGDTHQDIERLREELGELRRQHDRPPVLAVLEDDNDEDGIDNDEEAQREEQQREEQQRNQEERFLKFFRRSNLCLSGVVCLLLMIACGIAAGSACYAGLCDGSGDGNNQKGIFANLTENPECNQTTDCLVSDWTEWTSCSVECGGTRTRSRSIVQASQCGGEPCPDLEETEDCGFAVACKVSNWSFWSLCSEECGGTKSRTRSIVSPATCGGEDCPVLEDQEDCENKPVDCQVSQWSEWSGCSEKCGGKRLRTRTIVTQAQCGGICGALEEHEDCEIEPIDCQVSEWSDWSNCSQECGGRRTRTRTIISQAQCGGNCVDLEEHEDCQNPVDCVTTDWSPWGQCTQECGGTSTRTRKVVTQAQCGGKSCGDLEEEKTCQNPVDCVESSWGPWGQCTRECGGYKTRSRSILTHAQCGGSPCGDLEERENCNNPVDCVESAWGQWNQCTQECGGYRTRSRYIVSQAECGGTPCGNLQERENCNNPVDCQYTEWSAYSPCSSSCRGRQTSTRQITQYPGCGGVACPTQLSREQSCNPATPCVYSSWSSYTDCSQQCNGVQRRTRSVREYSNCPDVRCDDTERTKSCNPASGSMRFKSDEVGSNYGGLWLYATYSDIRVEDASYTTFYQCGNALVAGSTNGPCLTRTWPDEDGSGYDAVLSACHGGREQEWEVSSLRIRNPSADCCLDVYSGACGSTCTSTDVDCYPCDSSEADQQWTRY